jgi:hypothetical protein
MYASVSASTSAVAERPVSRRAKHSSRRPNTYKGTCRLCGAEVPAREGFLDGRSRDGWQIIHAECPPAQQSLPVEEPADAPVSPRATSPWRDIIGGTYTVVFEDDSYRTIKVEERPEDPTPFWEGKTHVLSYLSGRDNESDYTGFGHVATDGTVRIWRRHRDNTSLAEAVKVLAGDPEAAAKAYALKSSKCFHCGHKLTVEESIRRGMGPDCAAKAGW